MRPRRGRLSRQVVIALVSVGVHGLAGIALLVAGPLLYGPPAVDPGAESSVVMRPSEDEDLSSVIPDLEIPPPELVHDTPPDPQQVDKREESLPEFEDSWVPEDEIGAPEFDQAIAIRTARGRNRTPRPRGRPVRLRPEPRTPARVVTSSRMVLRHKDLSRTSGELKVKVKVGANGSVLDVVVQRRSGVVSFDEGTVASISSWRFQPERLGDEAVPSWIELTLSPARPKQETPPEYPERAQELGLEGTVRLAADVGLDGKVEAVRVLDSSGVGLLDKAAIAAVEGWSFHPARVNGRPARCTVEIKPIRFRFD